MLDDDDYGFMYLDEDEFNEDEVDIENVYYNVKGVLCDDLMDECVFFCECECVNGVMKWFDWCEMMFVGLFESGVNEVVMKGFEEVIVMEYEKGEWGFKVLK